MEGGRAGRRGSARSEAGAEHDDHTDLSRVAVTPDDPVSRAVRLMRERAISRLPVCEGDQPFGIVSIGDLAVEEDPRSELADISAAAPNP